MIAERLDADFPRRQAGFTLVETVVAMILVSAVVLPASLWLYRSRMNHAAWERFHAVQQLEDRMNRAFLQRDARGLSGQVQGLPILRFEIRAVDEAGERRLLGEVRDAKGRSIATLETVIFEAGEGGRP